MRPLIADRLRGHQAHKAVKTAGEASSIGWLGYGHGLLRPISLVVLSMRENVSDIDQLKVVANAGNQAILVAADVENGEHITSLGANGVGVRESTTHIRQIAPAGMDRDPMPMPQRPFGVRVSFPKRSQRLEADHPHLDILSKMSLEVKIRQFHSNSGYFLAFLVLPIACTSCRASAWPG